MHAKTNIMIFFTIMDFFSFRFFSRCLPNQTLPDAVKSTYKKGYWTEFMGRVMNYIGDNSVDYL